MLLYLFFLLTFVISFCLLFTNPTHARGYCIFELLLTMQQNDICAICRSDLHPDITDNHLTLPCNHSFHGSCIAQWLLTNQKTCPQCRQNVMEKDIQDETGFRVVLSQILVIVRKLASLYNSLVLIHLLLTTEWPINLYNIFVRFIFFKAPLDKIDPSQCLSNNLPVDIASIGVIAVLVCYRCEMIYRCSKYAIDYYLLPMLILSMIMSQVPSLF